MKFNDRQHPKIHLHRIFVRTDCKTMENQYCKVGAVTPIVADNDARTLLEYQYQNFLDKANNLEYADAKLVEFFEQKAQKIKRLLENIIK